jgi:hypothetical protein
VEYSAGNQTKQVLKTLSGGPQGSDWLPDWLSNKESRRQQAKESKKQARESKKQPPPPAPRQSDPRERPLGLC